MSPSSAQAINPTAIATNPPVSFAQEEDANGLPSRIEVGFMQGYGAELGKVVFAALKTVTEVAKALFESLLPEEPTINNSADNSSFPQHSSILSTRFLYYATGIKDISWRAVGREIIIEHTHPSVLEEHLTSTDNLSPFDIAALLLALSRVQEERNPAVQTQTFIKPELVVWARERAGLSEKDLAKKMSVSPERLHDWQTGKASLTIKQMKKLAQKTYTPFGYLLASKAPEETLPIADFRTFDDHDPTGRRPSGALLTTLYAMQRRQNWFRDYLMEIGADPVPLVGQCDKKQGVREVATALRAAYGVGEETGLSEDYPNKDTAISKLIAATAELGISVIRNDIVGNNTHRPLDVKEFRGFALCDRYAPLIFINGRDARAAQIFTLVHELVHLCIEESGVSNLDAKTLDRADATEKFCNRVATELLLPRASFLRHWKKNAELEPEDRIKRTAESFNVNTQAAVYRALDKKLIGRQEYWKFCEREEAERRRDKSAQGGGDFYATQKYRVGDRFAKAVIACAREGTLSYREAHELMDIKKTATFEKLAERFGCGR